MALRCFAKCPCRVHWWGICRGAQKAIWHHYEKLPRRVPNCHQLGPYKLTPLLEALIRYAKYSKPAIYRVKLESGLVTKDDCQVLPPLCPLQAETAVVGSQQSHPCGSISTVTTGQKPVVDGFPVSPLSIQIPHPRRQGPSHPVRPVSLYKVWSPWSSHGLAWHKSSGGSMPLEDVVDGSKSQTYATSNSTLPHAPMGKCKHFMPDIYRVWTGHY